MLDDIDEAAVIAADILNEILQKIKQSRPTVSKDGTTQGFVFAIQEPGEMISPRDFAAAWTPIGGTPQSPRAGDAPATPPADETVDPAAAESRRRAQQAAFNTYQKMNSMLLVTDDGTVASYSGGGRDLGQAYADLLAAMEAAPLPERDPADVARIDKARALLWDEDGYETAAYQRYLDNAQEYQDSQADYALQSSR